MGILLWLLPTVSWLALAVNVAVQVGVCRGLPQWTLMRSIFAGFLAGFALLAAVEASALVWGQRTCCDALCSAAVNAMPYGALGFCYFHFINLGETARRIRIVREIDAAGRPLAREEILERYGAAEIVSVRIDRLLGAGQIVFRDGRYCLANPTVLYMARSIVLMKLLVLGKRSEFA